MMDIIAAIKQFDDVLSGNGVEDIIISEAEKELGMSFAMDYCEYLRNFGIVAVNGHELTGLGSTKRVNVVDVTLSKRRLLGDQMSKHYVIEDLNIDGVIVWQSEDGDIIVSTEDGNTKKAFPSLIEYIQS